MMPKALPPLISHFAVKAVAVEGRNILSLSIFRMPLDDARLTVGACAEAGHINGIIRDGKHIECGLGRCADYPFGAGRAPLLNKRAQC